jgi:acyl carrier protein
MLAKAVYQSPCRHHVTSLPPSCPSSPLQVYCSEVEAVLVSHPDVAQAAVFGVPNAVLGELVAAAVVLKPRQAGGPQAQTLQRELIDWTRARLAHYKVPSQVHVVAAMPVTGSGKVLKTELRRLFTSAAPQAAATSHVRAVAPAGAAPAPYSPLPVVAAAAGSSSSAAQQQLATRVASALQQAAVIDLTLATRPMLHAHASYVLPLVSPGSLLANVTAALDRGARHLLLLTAKQPSGQALAQLEAALQDCNAQAAVVLVDAATASDDLLAFSVLDAAQACGAPPLAGVLLLPATQQQLAVPGLASEELAARVTAALPSLRVLAAKEAAQDTVTCILTLSDAVPMEQQVAAALDAGARHLLLLAGGEPSAAGVLDLEAVLWPVGAAAVIVLVDSALASNAAALAFAMLDAAQGMPAIGALLPPTAAASTQPVAAAAAPVPVAAEASMAAVLQSTLRELLGPEAAAGIAHDEPLMSAGLNSTLAVALTTQLEATLGTSLPPTLVFDYVNLRDMAAFLATTVMSGHQPQQLTAAAAAPTARAAALLPVVGPAATSSVPASDDAARRLVTAAVQDLLGGSAELDPAAPLMSAGLNSTMAVALAASIEAAVGSPVPPTLVRDALSSVQSSLACLPLTPSLRCVCSLVTSASACSCIASTSLSAQAFDHPSIDNIARFLTESALLPASPLPTAAAQPLAAAAVRAAATRPAPAVLQVQQQPQAPPPIIVVASSVRAPGGSNPVHVLGAQHAGTSGNGSSVVPLCRWDVDLALPSHAPGELQARFGCFLDGVEMFDPEAVGMTPAEVVLVDPQQRLVMEAFGDVAAAASAAGVYNRSGGCTGAGCTAVGVRGCCAAPSACTPHALNLPTSTAGVPACLWGCHSWSMLASRLTRTRL